MLDEHGNPQLPGLGTGCRPGSHRARPSPDAHPELGMVPARSSCWIGGLVLLVAVLVLYWLVPSWLPWTALVLAGWIAVVAFIQFGLGHRGRCLARRSLRWFLGPIGALLDPFDAG